MPLATQIDRREVDPVATTSGGAFSSLRVSCDDVLEFLAKGKVVSESQWRHEYSHVAFGDRTARLTLRDRTVLQWLVRPGGLACLEWPDGRPARPHRERNLIPFSPGSHLQRPCCRQM